MVAAASNPDRSWGHKQTVEAPAHRAALVAQKRGARDLKGRDRLRAEVAGIDVLLARWVASGRNLGSVVGRTGRRRRRARQG